MFDRSSSETTYSSKRDSVGDYVGRGHSSFSFSALNQTVLNPNKPWVETASQDRKPESPTGEYEVLFQWLGVDAVDGL